jgi:quercetin dioxygenase-like cupin family protein
MSRPHIEFIQQQDMPFESVEVDGASQSIGVKRLSVDQDSGASSSLVQFPPGWRRPGRGHNQHDEEFYVLAGDLTVSGVHYTEHTYAYLPSGYTCGDSTSKAGALVLAFHDRRGQWVEGEAPAGTLDERRLVLCLNMFEAPWTGNFHPQFPVGAGRKWLRRDALTADETWILGTLPLRNGRRPEKHPVVEEMYLISGELIGPQGVMRPGAYFWRPPEVWHGPYGSKTGCLMLFRTVGGPLSTVYTDDEQDFEWNPEHYTPILPPEVQQRLAASRA